MNTSLSRWHSVSALRSSRWSAPTGAPSGTIVPTKSHGREGQLSEQHARQSDCSSRSLLVCGWVILPAMTRSSALALYISKLSDRFTASTVLGWHNEAPFESPQPSSVGETVKCSRGSSLSRHDIGPQGLELIRLEEIPPWWHLVLAARHRIDEALVLVERKFPQVECRVRILHARAVTRRAVDRVELRAGRDLVLREALRLFRCGRRCHREKCKGY